jgi:MtrB/PioB family decaheme-associated outer membrane protein
MNTKLIPLLVGSLFAATAASAADEDVMTWDGSSISIGVRGSKQEGDTRNGASATSSTVTTAPLAPFTGPEDKAKMNEYRDVSSGVIGSFDFIGTSKQKYLRFFGENLGYSDQFLNLRGGDYGNYKYQLFDDRMPHNLSWGALTPLNGTGGSQLTNPGVTYPPSGPATDPSTWNKFDYSLKREVIGGNFEYQFNPAWYTRFGYNETTMQGTRPFGGRLGTSSSNGMIEFGAPTDYRTKDFTFDVGYSTKESSFSMNYLNSTFSNANPFVQWTNFFMLNQLDTSTLPPDNALNRLGLNGTLRNLPVNSTLAVRATWSELSNNFGVTSGGLMPTNNVLNPVTTGSPAAVGNLVTPASRDTFVGDVQTKTASVSLTSNLGEGVDSKIFYNYYDSHNNSTLITYANGFLGTGPCPAVNYASSSTATQFCIGPYPNSLYSSTKQDYGVEGGWRMNRANKLSGGVNWLDISREGREDAPKTDTSNLWAEYKNSSLDSLSGRLKYLYTQRRSELVPARPVGQSPFADATPAQVPYYFVAYDVSNANANQIKLVLDWTPMPLLDMGLETAWKKTDYKDLSYGRTDDRRQEYNFTVSYGDPKGFRVTGLYNYELVEFNQSYRNGAPASGPSPNDPSNFDWGTKNTQTNTLFGLIADWATTEQLALKASYIWTKTGGGVDFNSGNTATTGGFSGGPLVNYVTDNTKKQTFNLKGDYKFDRQWTGTLGYVIEKYDYNDDQMKGYQGYYPYYQYLGGNNSSWFSGAFANPGYKLQVVYLVGTYKF